MMKIFYFLLFFVVSQLPAQVGDTILYNEERGTLKDQEMFSDYDYAFLTKEPTNFLWKINAPYGQFIEGFGSDLSFNFYLGYEQKIGKAFSLNTEVGINFHIDSFEEYGLGPNGLKVSLESRWYYSMIRKIADKKSASNLSGAYLGLELTSQYATLLKYGLQKRFFKHAYVDLSIGAGAQYKQVLKNFEAIVQTSIKLGFVFGKKTSIDYKDRQCSVFRCYKEEKQLIKFNLINFFSLISREDYTYIAFRPKVDYEFKINNSPFSVVLQGGIAIEYNQFISVNSGSPVSSSKVAIGYNLGIEPRFYYNLKKRIASGKSANNFSASYLFLNGSYYRTSSTETNTGAAIFGWGIQRRIFDFGYLDFQAGGISEFKYAGKNGSPVLPYISFKFGIALN